MRINGQEVVIPNGITVQQLLEKRKYLADRVAVELNGEIVKRADFEATFLSEEDKMEIVAFVGGG